MDSKGYVIGCLVAGVGDEGRWQKEIAQAGMEALAEAEKLVGRTKKTWNPEGRGDFKFVNVGYSFGTGSLVSARASSPLPA